MLRFVAPKSSLFQPVLRVVEKWLRFWKLFLLFLMSPLAGRYSPVRESDGVEKCGNHVIGYCLGFHGVENIRIGTGRDHKRAKG